MSYSFLSLIFFVIHGMKWVTRVYTPGYCPFPQPMPQETMPTCVHVLPSCTISGPPESPYEKKTSQLPQFKHASVQYFTYTTRIFRGFSCAQHRVDNSTGRSSSVFSTTLCISPNGKCHFLQNRRLGSTYKQNKKKILPLVSFGYKVFIEYYFHANCPNRWR